MAARLRYAGIKTFLLSDTNRPHFEHFYRNSAAVRNADERFLSFRAGLRNF
ncbi:MAG: hypothetical protein AABZ57_02885 [Candidatus Margulisiibacteriota bacterium]